MGRFDARATVDWQGYGGSVSSASGLLSTATAAQVELGGPGGATNPEELFAAAHANCFTSTITSMARARGIDLARVVTEAAVRLEWSEGGGDHRLTTSDLAVRLTSAAGEDVLRALVDDATEHCPVCQAIRGNVAMHVTAAFDAP
ncbi:MAG: lipoyl-dependent peroxiredoxin [Gaiellales bacterium]|jgi:Ohr subfamily peroxiredoxin|nr:lipoyl-dependent peroxiredoxin [Gaiellales bacterium]MDX6599706.1 lipoyl-dependent peroxiredoxin [Gaiellales bacterium]